MSAPRRRKGLIPLILGLLSMLVGAPAAVLIGIAVAVGSMVGHVTEQPPTVPPTGLTVEAEAQQMFLVMVPSEQSADTTCTATSPEQAALTTVPAGNDPVVLADGRSYTPVVGVGTLEATPVTVQCEGPGAAGAVVMGPLGIMEMGLPLLIGLGVSLLLGLLGLGLTILGIVRLLRSRPGAGA
ncbi:hypothetical protein JSY14_05255 [Brachybacterium sp. EF45031]|uniref:hypothetical protein n=1 Tax=Brachybacterium sillae TaxID=2810536 RepID=UPI00217CC898|nr:hypothetical protein [Brachybacterium sillae]MCS6711459.1 hypothetical protein [Brachybacterium sillae]